MFHLPVENRTTGPRWRQKWQKMMNRKIKIMNQDTIQFLNNFRIDQVKAKCQARTSATTNIRNNDSKHSKPKSSKVDEQSKQHTGHKIRNKQYHQIIIEINTLVGHEHPFILLDQWQFQDEDRPRAPLGSALSMDNKRKKCSRRLST